MYKLKLNNRDIQEELYLREKDMHAMEVSQNIIYLEIQPHQNHDMHVCLYVYIEYA
jgi:hypothetical protein